MSKDRRNLNWEDKDIFTTGEAAEICNVSLQTIIRCFDTGRLHGFRVPGSKFRRIPRAELLRFLKTCRIPTDALESKLKRVLVVDDDPQMISLFKDLFASDDRLELRTAMTGYDGGLLTEQFKPHLIILDLHLPDLDGRLVCNRIRSNPSFAETRVLVCSGVASKEEIGDLKCLGADGFIRKPFDLQEMVWQVEDLLNIDRRHDLDIQIPDQPLRVRARKRARNSNGSFHQETEL